jgi:hypothetical protein
VTSQREGLSSHSCAVVVVKIVWPQRRCGISPYTWPHAGRTEPRFAAGVQGRLLELMRSRPRCRTSRSEMVGDSQRPGIPTNLLCLTDFGPHFSPDQIENENAVREFRRWTQKVHLVLWRVEFQCVCGCCCARSTPPLRLSAGANETPGRIQSHRFDSTRGCAEELWRGGSVHLLSNSLSLRK